MHKYLPLRRKDLLLYLLLTTLNLSLTDPHDDELTHRVYEIIMWFTTCVQVNTAMDLTAGSGVLSSNDYTSPNTNPNRLSQRQTTLADPHDAKQP